MSLKSLFQNCYFYLFLGCMGTLGSLGLTLLAAEKANSKSMLGTAPETALLEFPGQIHPQPSIYPYG